MNSGALMRVAATTLLLALAQAAVYSQPAAAAQLIPPGRLSLAIVIDGDEIILKHPGLPVQPGQVICVAQKELYTSPDSRLIHVGWLVDSRIVSGDCLEVPDGAVSIEPYYRLEYRVRIKSSPPEVYEATAWVGAGGVYEATIPLELERDNARYRLLRVDGPGELVGGRLRIPVAGPVEVILVYEAEYLVRVALDRYGLDPLEAWLASGEQGVLEIPEKVEVADGVMLVLAGVKGVGVNVQHLGGGLLAVVPEKPGGLIIPEYRVLYRIRYTAPDGTRVLWVPKGERVTISVPQTLKTTDPAMEILVFRGWRGGVESITPSLEVEASGPLDLEAVYERMVKVVVEGPLGTKEYWVEEGGSLVVYQPEAIPGLILGRVLRGYLVGNNMVPPGPGGVLAIENIREPLVIVPVYDVQVMWANVALLSGVIVGVVLIYIAYDFLMAWRAERRGGEGAS